MESSYRSSLLTSREATRTEDSRVARENQTNVSPHVRLVATYEDAGPVGEGFEIEGSETSRNPPRTVIIMSAVDNAAPSNWETSF